MIHLFIVTAFLAFKSWRVCYHTEYEFLLIALTKGFFVSGKSIPFEIAVGMNGRVWIRARTAKESICLGMISLS